MPISPKTAFDIGSKAVLPGWIAVSMFPGHAWTEKIVEFAVLTNAAIYLYSGMNGNFPEGGGFNSLRQVTSLFRGGNDYVLNAAWVHYLAFDLFVGNWISKDAKDAKIGRPIVFPFLMLTLMAGPLGPLFYKVFRLMRG